ncbi:MULTISPECIES: ethanolamine utilization microcompartment protein EutL [unclassified Clostridium]|uniref:ethanolamine utilization microcompartment protein EutL n=1 Tax=unclassified Clostridium TaxID=2614128 RepID=UPI000EC08779|nr:MULTISPECIES: ethanolamine utilization microcompartment protein EutL [unclassified Clostridium]HCQ89808.1 microcompartment protein EutL [Clostridium sp.]
MKNDQLRASVLSVKLIANVNPDMAKEFELKPEHKSIGIITADSDDVTYTALDEATKAADVEVVYARSFYGGAANANTKLAGEVIGILAGPSPAEVRSGLNAAVDFIESGVATFYSANEDDSIVYYAQPISRTGSYLSKTAGVKEGEAIAYLIAPPVEAMYALDAAMKAAAVELKAFFGPPSETNFGGGLLTGSQSAVKAACDAFAEAVKFVADNPTDY